MKVKYQITSRGWPNRAKADAYWRQGYLAQKIFDLGYPCDFPVIVKWTKP